MKSRAKHAKPNKKHSKSFSKSKYVKNKNKKRKAYSIFANESKNGARTEKTKGNNEDNLISIKRAKIENEKEENVELSSDSESEVENHLKHLCETFMGSSMNKKSLAIDSDDDSSENEGNSDSDDKNTKDEQDDKSTNEYEGASDNGNTLEDCLSENESKQEECLSENEEIKTGGMDPFMKHLFFDLDERLLSSVQTNPIPVDTHTQKWSALGNLTIQIPKFTETITQQKHYIAESKQFASPGTIPKLSILNRNNLNELNIKIQVAENIFKVNKSDEFSQLQSEIFSIINDYQDFYFPQRKFDNAEEIRFIYCLHAVNHVLKTRTRILHHNSKLSRKDDVPEDFRDQGLVRPKILIIVPFRNSAYKIIKLITDILICEDKGNVINKIRFLDDYTGNEIVMPKKNPKPEDYELTFTGNCNDDFKIGLTITKKSLKLYTDFYSSDVIIASPLGLRYTIGAEGEPERDYDFLASIELLIMDQAEIFLMQNWDHVLHILNHMHLQPKESHGTDFSRVRTWSLNGWSKYYRQTLIFSSIVLPEINALFNKKCFNYAGKVKITNTIQSGSISQIFVQLPHVFYKFEANNVTDAIEARFDFFISKVLPQQRDALMKQTMIYIPNYFDYVKVRNYFKRDDASFVQICEYSKEGKVARARDMFYHGDTHFLLYTERYHFFNRIKVKGIRHIVFYQPPSFPNFYYEICNLMQEANMNKKIGSTSNMTVTVLYCKYDVHQLSAVVGTEKAVTMLNSERNVHMMVTGDD